LPSPSDDNKKKLTNRLPGSGVRRDLKETWGTIISKTQNTVGERNNTEARIVMIDRLSPNPDQPRKVFDPEGDDELAQDVKMRGILEPLIVRPIGEDENGTLYQIVAGERRYRAALKAELPDVPVIIKTYTDREAKLTSLVENLQRQNLHAEDEARYFNLLIEQFNLSYKEIAGLVNRSASYVANRMKLLNPLLLEDLADEEGETENATRETDSDENHKHSKSARKLQKSQANTAYLKPILRFQTFIAKTKIQLPKLASEDRQALAEQIKELREQLTDLEKEATKE
jgi:ParB family chromosome partitioning protein